MAAERAKLWEPTNTSVAAVTEAVGTAAISGAAVWAGLSAVGVLAAGAGILPALPVGIVAYGLFVATAKFAHGITGRKADEKSYDDEGSKLEWRAVPNQELAVSVLLGGAIGVAGITAGLGLAMSVAAVGLLLAASHQAAVLYQQRGFDSECKASLLHALGWAAVTVGAFTLTASFALPLITAGLVAIAGSHWYAGESSVLSNIKATLFGSVLSGHYQKEESSSYFGHSPAMQATAIHKPVM
jgi:hypothetical protein